MDLKDIASQVAKIGLPLLGAVLPIPGGAAIGAALASAIGSPTDKPEDLLKTLTSSAEALQKGKEFEATHQERMLDLKQKHELEMYAAEVDDRKSARQREVDTKDTTVAKLAWMMIGGFIIMSMAQLVAIMGWPEVVVKIPGQGWLLIGNISGYLANEAKQAAAYYFGSSSGSKDKDATLAEIAKS